MIENISHWINRRQILLSFIIVAIIGMATVVYHREYYDRDLIGVHFWRLSQTQSNIIQFARNDFNILNPAGHTYNGGTNIKRQEFPLVQWSIAAMYKIFGESLLLTRICMIAITMIGVWYFFRLILHLTQSIVVSSITTLAYTFCPILYYYTINPLPDVGALSCSVAFMYYYVCYLDGKKSLWYAGIFLCLAAMIKLPYIIFGAFMIPKIVGDIKTIGIKKYISEKDLGILIATLAPVVMWYAYAMKDWTNSGVLQGVFGEAVDYNKYYDILRYHLLVMLPEYLFNSISKWIFYLSAALVVWRLIKDKGSKYTRAFTSLGIVVLFYFIYELNMIGTIHEYYMMPFIPLVYTIFAYGIYKIINLNQYFAIPLTLVTMICMNATNQYIRPFYSNAKLGYDENIIKNKKVLSSFGTFEKDRCIFINDESGYEWSYYFDKQGYVFAHDHLPGGWVKDMIDNMGVRLMYSNSRKVDQDTSVNKYFEKTLFESSTIKVFKLKGK